MREDNFDNEMETEEEIFTLTDEDGKESDFRLIGRHDDDGQSYVALIPIDENGEEIDIEDDEDGGFVILKVVEDEDGEESLVEIEDDEEFDRIADIFEDELFDDLDYDDEDEDDEEESEEDEEE